MPAGPHCAPQSTADGGVRPPAAATGGAPEVSDVRRAQIASLARFTPINSLVTLCASLLTAAILWPDAPQPLVALWAALLAGPAAWLLLRWQIYRRRPAAARDRAGSSGGSRGLQQAVIWAALSGAVWGAGALFLPHVPPAQKLALIIVTSAMAGGATTTLAALPRAAALFIVCSLLPYAGWFVLQADAVYFGLALMALAMTAAMLGSTRIVHATFMEDLKNRRANAALMQEFQTARQEWLDISDTAEAFALYDGADRLLLWNKSYPTLLSIPEHRLHRGAARAEVMSHAARAVDAAGDPAQGDGNGAGAASGRTDGAGDALVTRLDNGRWIRTHERRTADGHTAVVHFDVTELMSREQALRSSEETLRQRERYFRSLIENTSDIISLLGADGRLRFQSAAAETALGYASGELEGVDGITLVHPDDVDKRARMFREIVAEPGSVARLEYRVRHKDGSWRMLAAVAKNALDVPGVEGIVFNSRDITELKQREEQLHQAQKMEAVGQLTGGVAHDFNNLLTAIIGNLEMACLKLEEKAPVRPMIEVATRAAERGAKLTQHLLAFARKQPLQPEAIDVDDLLGNMSALLERSLGSNIEVMVEAEAGLWPVQADASQLQNALINLAVNARDAMPQGGRVTIAAANRSVAAGPADSELKAGDYVAISVADTGTGMDGETLQRAFEPFFTTKELGRGSGLGLSMVFGFTKQSGGHATAESALGEGTTISLLLPRASAAAAAGPETAAAPPTAPGSGRVLVVEDDADVREIAVGVLQRAGYTVLSAADGSEALAVLEEADAVDLLFCDVLLPGGMTGREVAEAAQALQPGLPVLFASGYTREVLSEQGRLLPGVDLLAKPYSGRSLVERVAQTLGGGSREEVA